MPTTTQDASITDPHRLSGAGQLSRGQILDATDACFAADGYDGTTIRAIASRLNCSVGSIYRYFTDKRELLLACAARMMQPALDAESFDGSVRTYQRLVEKHGELYRLQFFLVGRGLPEVVVRIVDRWTEWLRDRDEAEHRWATMHGLLMFHAPSVRSAAELRQAQPPQRRISDLPQPPEPEEDVVMLD